MTADILFLTTSYPRAPGDAAGHFVESEVRRALAEGNSVRVLAAGAPRVHPTSGEEFEPLGGSSIFRSPGALPRLEAKPLRALRLPFVFLRTSLALLRAKEPEWRVQFLVPFAPFAVLLAPSRVRVTLVGHGSDVRLLERLPPLFSALFVRIVASRNVTYRFVSEELRERFLSLPGAARLRERTIVAPSPLELPRVPSKLECRKELAIENERTAVVVGRLLEMKRVDVALEALVLAGLERIFVVGEGPERSYLEALFPTVTFVGEVPREKALRFVRAADLLVAASRHEGAPTAIREARLLGTPVVSTRAGDLESLAANDAELFVVD